MVEVSGEQQAMGENQVPKEEVKSMEYHRQVLKGKLEDESYDCLPSSYYPPLPPRMKKKPKEKKKERGKVKRIRKSQEQRKMSRDR